MIIHPLFRFHRHTIKDGRRGLRPYRPQAGTDSVLRARLERAAFGFADYARVRTTAADADAFRMTFFVFVVRAVRGAAVDIRLLACGAAAAGRLVSCGLRALRVGAAARLPALHRGRAVHLNLLQAAQLVLVVAAGRYAAFQLIHRYRVLSVLILAALAAVPVSLSRAPPFMRPKPHIGA